MVYIWGPSAWGSVVGARENSRTDRATTLGDSVSKITHTWNDHRDKAYIQVQTKQNLLRENGKCTHSPTPKQEAVCYLEREIGFLQWNVTISTTFLGIYCWATQNSLHVFLCTSFVLIFCKFFFFWDVEYWVGSGEEFEGAGRIKNMIKIFFSRKISWRQMDGSRKQWVR